MGTMLVSVVSQVTGSTNAGVSSLAVMFVLGLLCFGKAVKARKKFGEEQ